MRLGLGKTKIGNEAIATQTPFLFREILVFVDLGLLLCFVVAFISIANARGICAKGRLVLCMEYEIFVQKYQKYEK